MLVVLVSGYATSGKDTFSDMLIRRIPGAKKYSFARELKIIAAEHFGWDGKKDERGRRLLINIGRTGREYNINLWVDKVIDRIKAELPALAVVSDWRFKNEFYRMVEIFGRENVITVRVIREGIQMIYDPSEMDLDDFQEFDCFVYNNGTLEELQTTVERYIEEYIKPRLVC